MTPSARYAASIEILDKIIAGAPAERELTIWARGNRFAGSKDRAAIRDLVYDALRNLRSYAHLSGLDGARGIFIGRLIAKNEEINLIFNGQGYGPAGLSDIEQNAVDMQKNDMPYAVQMDIPNWISSKFNDVNNYDILKSRAPIDLRVNLKKITLKSAIAEFVEACAKRGVELKWFGEANPHGFTSRYESWKYVHTEPMAKTDRVLSGLLDLRLPLSFTKSDCTLIASIIKNVVQKLFETSNANDI